LSRQYHGRAAVARQRKKMEGIEQTVRKFIVEGLFRGAPQEIGRDVSLLQSGIPDSMGLFRRIFLLQETYGLTIAHDEMLAENFETLLRITKFVKSKTSDRHV